MSAWPRHRHLHYPLILTRVSSRSLLFLCLSSLTALSMSWFLYAPCWMAHAGWPIRCARYPMYALCVHPSCHAPIHSSRSIRLSSSALCSSPSITSLLCFAHPHALFLCCPFFTPLTSSLPLSLSFPPFSPLKSHHAQAHGSTREGRQRNGFTDRPIRFRLTLLATPRVRAAPINDALQSERPAIPAKTAHSLLSLHRISTLSGATGTIAASCRQRRCTAPSSSCFSTAAS